MSYETIDLRDVGRAEGISPPLIRLSSEEIIKKIIRSISILDVSQKYLDFINASIKLCMESENKITSLEKIAHELNVSIPTTRNYVNYLTELGVYNKKNCTTDVKSKRRGLLYDLQDPVFNVKPPTKKTEVSSARFKIPLEDIELIPKEELTDIAICDLITTVLFGALRFNQKGNPKKIESTVLWGSERVKVETSSGKGERIALLKDLKYYIASITVLESIIKGRIERGLEVTETYNIPMNSILTVLNLPKTGGNKQLAIKAIRQLSGTTFHIKELPKWFLRKFDMAQNSVMHLNMMNLRVEGHSKEVQGSIVLQIQFPPETIAQVKRSIVKSTYAIHELTHANPYVFSISNNLVFAFNLWTSAYFNDKGLAVMNWLELKDRTAPQFTLTEFKRSFSLILMKYAVIAIKINGYDSNNQPVEDIDTEYKPIYRNGIAIKETANIYGIKIALEDNEFVLMQELKKGRELLQNMAFQHGSIHKK